MGVIYDPMYEAQWAKVREERKREERYDEMWEIYQRNKVKPWTPFLWCFLLDLFFSYCLDPNGFISLTIWSFIFFWLPVACVWSCIKVGHNNKLRKIYKVNTPEMEVETRLTQGALLGLAAAGLKGGGSAIKSATTPHDKDI